jgi:hypothetical protein
MENKSGCQLKTILRAVVAEFVSKARAEVVSLDQAHADHWS